MYIFSFISFFLAYICVFAEDGASFIISKTPNTAIKPGGTITISCEMKEKSTILWYRKAGLLVSVIANNGEFLDSFSRNTRYYLTRKHLIGIKYTEMLSIDGLAYEDIASLGCSIAASSEKVNYTVVQVCDDIESDWCNCIGRKGWLDPRCFEISTSLHALHSKYDKVAAALGVCLAIAIIYGVVLSIMVGWDCMQKIHQKRKENIQKKLCGIPTVDSDRYSESRVLNVPDDLDSQASYDCLPSSSASMPTHFQVKRQFEMESNHNPDHIHEERNHTSNLRYKSTISNHTNPAFVHDGDYKDISSPKKYSNNNNTQSNQHFSGHGNIGIHTQERNHDNKSNGHVLNLPNGATSKIEGVRQYEGDSSYGNVSPKRLPNHHPKNLYVDKNSHISNNFRREEYDQTYHGNTSLPTHLNVKNNNHSFVDNQTYYSNPPGHGAYVASNSMDV